MKRRLLVNLGLLVVVAALALLVRFQPGIEPGDHGERLTGLDAGEVSALTIRRPGAAELRFTRQGARWRMESPVEVEANAFRLDPLARVVEARVHATFDAETLDLGRYGLDPPRAELGIDGSVIAFGDTEPIDRRRYVLFSGKVHLIDDHYFERLQPGFPAFVSNALLPDTGRARRIDLPHLSLLRDDTGRWSAVSGETASEDGAGSPEEIAGEWERAQGIEVVRHDGREAEKKVRIVLEDGRTIEFAVIPDGDGLLLARPDLGVAWRLTGIQARRLLPQAAPEAGAS